MSDGKIKQRIVYVLTRKNKADDDTNLYVGSTSQTLEQRLSKHRSYARNFIGRGCRKDNRLFKRMNEVGLWNWKIIPLISRTCDIKEIREVERKWIRILKADLNTILPIREEETIQEYQSKYRENNRTFVRQCVFNSFKNIESKKYYCDVCDLACRSNHDLKNHLDTYNHFMKWIWSVN